MMNISMLLERPAAMEPRVNSVRPTRNRGFLPYRSESFPAMGIITVSQSR